MAEGPQLPQQPKRVYVGVDPGITNMGICSLTADDEIVDSFTINLGSSSWPAWLLAKKAALELRNAIDRLHQDGEYRCVSIAVEDQSSLTQKNPKLCAIGSALLGAAVGMRLPSESVTPMQWKSDHGVRATGDHAENKRVALLKAKEQWPEHMFPTDHEADAAFIASYVARLYEV
jgi:hypothetical protein